MVICHDSFIKSEQFSLFLCDQSAEVEGAEYVSDFDSSPLGPFSVEEFSGMCHSFPLLYVAFL